MEQQTIVSGDSLDFVREVIGFPASDGWTLRYRLIPRNDALAVIEFAAATHSDGVRYRAQQTAAQTATWGAGPYGWNSWVEQAGDVRSVEGGQITILPDPRVLVAGTDTRSQAQKAVDDLLAARADMASSPQARVKEYEIAGRRVVFGSVREIDDELQFQRAEVFRENDRGRLASGKRSARRIGVRFGNA